MKRALFVLLTAAACYAQESKFGADLRHEREDFTADCGAGGVKGIFGCAKDLFTDWPFHIAVGSLAPQNGFGAGAAIVEHANTEFWRFSWDADAVATPNASWRAGLYMKAVYTKQPPIIVVPGRTSSANLVREFPVINGYVQGISLNTLDLFSPLGNQTTFGMREIIAGMNATLPIAPKLRLSLYGEVNGRFVKTSPFSADANFLQTGEGIRFRPVFFSDHFELNYQLTYQQFVGGANNNFQRFTADLNHDFPIYGHSFVRSRSTNGPDECATSPKEHNCPVMMNRTGSFGLRFLLSNSFTSGNNNVPFYLQPTLGGSDINGQQLLPSYHDYRFRAPNIMLLRASFEHSIWGPFGIQVLYDTGKAALDASDLDFTHMAHSFAGGFTFRAGGIPEVSLLFATGGGSQHNILMMNNSLLGGGARPSLF